MQAYFNNSFCVYISWLITYTGAQGLECPVGALPKRSHATLTTVPDGGSTGTVVGGTTAVYTCDANYIVSPDATLASTTPTRTVTCDDCFGIFVDLSFQCARKYPTYATLCG